MKIAQRKINLGEDMKRESHYWGEISRDSDEANGIFLPVKCTPTAVWKQTYTKSDANKYVISDKICAIKKNSKSHASIIMTNYNRLILEVDLANIPKWLCSKTSENVKEKPRDIIVLMQNPSVGVGEKCDATLLKLARKLHTYYERMIVLNITTQVSTRPRFVSKWHYQNSDKLRITENDINLVEEKGLEDVAKIHDARTDEQFEGARTALKKTLDYYADNTFPCDILLATGGVKGEMIARYRILMNLITSTKMEKLPNSRLLIVKLLKNHEFGSHPLNWSLMNLYDEKDDSIPSRIDDRPWHLTEVKWDKDINKLVETQKIDR